MIYLLITFAGLLLIIAGLYAMSFGFSTPPNFLLFLVGLVSFVVGVMLVILFVSKVDMASLKSSKPKSSKPEAKATPVNERVKIKKSTGAVETAMKPKKIEPRPKKVIKPTKSTADAMVKKDKLIKPPKKTETTAEQDKPSKTPRKFLKLPKFGKKDQEEKPSPESPVNSSMVKSDEQSKIKDASTDEITPKRVPRRPLMNKLKEDVSMEKPVDVDNAISDSSGDHQETPMEPMKPIKPVKKIDKNDTHYVKERLNKLKQEYIENVDDVEDLIEERLDSFRGALNKIRSESMEPSIIWSFDASDVQEAMKETILKADEKVIMMYPWIRNIDVGILKKFMDTDSMMIIQEASLDDDASVELIKVLYDNGVQIRTMPHIHTVAVVSDNTHGLIISTDPIYESFEVGVIYKDERSINEIEKLFEEAWNLSNEIDMGAA
ncbi:hypothetical protein [Methanobacterium alcaliphilum]|uniref:hypothetical protein n=1 Tax=Methanobacterium alcaliphilum TaxID=392018 RepID=UPI00200B3153|nr:hypothetical protein [Methanobacterium alcaliphilum]MCK9151292.1 hypothetical protein [Methanobacterium alcaliphilum]